jgi:hypothetical protein
LTANRFKDRYRELQQIARELSEVRKVNLYAPANDPARRPMSEGLLTLLALERFLRIVLGSRATRKDTLRPLLRMVMEPPLNIRLPGHLDPDGTIKLVTDVRNTLMHGNFEEAADRVGATHKDDYFISSAHVRELEMLYKVTNRIMAQIDPDTGRPRTGPEIEDYLASPEFGDLLCAIDDSEFDQRK